MKNIEWTNEKCPVHNTEIERPYTLGKHHSVTVWTFKGCQCGVCQEYKHFGTHYTTTDTYHESKFSAFDYGQEIAH